MMVKVRSYIVIIRSVNDGALLLDERSAVAERIVENGDDDKMLTIRLAEGLVVETAM